MQLHEMSDEMLQKDVEAEKWGPRQHFKIEGRLTLDGLI
jgi:hypothetical protein